MMRLSTKKVLKRLLMCVAFFYSLFYLSSLRAYLPKCIRLSNILYLTRSVVEWEYFPVEGADDALYSNESFPVTVDSDKIRKYLMHWSTEVDFAPKTVMSEFRQLMTLQDREKMLITFETFIRVCEATKLTYFIRGGTLLGVYRHHGFIPWDDDIDVVMNVSDWRKIRYVLSHVPGYQLHVTSRDVWKFYMRDLPIVPNRLFKWPYLDIFFFTEDSTSICHVAIQAKDDIFEKKFDLFPLQYRPFENLKVAVPCNFEDLVLREYDTEMCVSTDFSHKTYKEFGVKQIPCKELHHAYPFVFRSKAADGYVVELLKVGDRVVKNITLPNFCVFK